MIFVITHKSFDDSIVDNEHYCVLHVGKNDNCKENYFRDDTGDNISEKNNSYCELTGLYWIWKNSKLNGSEVTGLVHYRRYFTTRIGDLMYTYFNIMPDALKYSLVEKSLKSADIILPKRVNIARTVKRFYADLHVGEDIEFARDAVLQAYPDYVNSFDSVMNKHYFYYANMMICRKELLDDYCLWLFNVMDILQQKINLDKYEDKYQARVFGFISERLLQVWVEHNGLKVKEYPVFNTEEKRITIFKKNFNRLKNVISYTRRRL